MTDDERNLLDDLLNVEHGLSAWEVGFIDSLDRARDRPLSPAQRAKLNELADKCDLGSLLSDA